MAPRPHPALAAYLRSIRRFPVLTREDEHEIATRFRDTGDPALARRLVQANLRFVVRIALSFKSERAKLTDLIQEGNLGLMHAVRKFDPAAGFRLVTYAARWISAYIRKFVMSNKRLVKIGTSQRERKVFSNLSSARARLEISHGAGVTDAHLAAELNVRERDVEGMALRLGASEVPLERPTADGEPQDWLPSHQPSADELIERREDLASIHVALAGAKGAMSERERRILDLRLIAEEPATLEELSREFGVTRERVRQIEVRLKARLAQSLRQSAA